ncbi:MAG TPA: hypothetical protein VGE58_06040 [Daejeonella sp.]
MNNKIPSEIQELLNQITEPEIIQEFSKRWNDYVKINEEYERNYPLQLGNIVEHNHRFKTDKTIPTPAEQLQGFKDQLSEEIDQHIYGRDQSEELTYPVPEQTERGRSLDQSQELSITWIKDYKAEREEQERDNVEVVKQDKEKFDFKLIFENFEKQDDQRTGKQPEKELEDLEPLQD